MVAPLSNRARQFHPRLAPGDVDLGRDDGLDDLRKPQREQRQIRGAQPQHQQADQKPRQTAGEVPSMMPRQHRHRVTRTLPFPPDGHRLARQS